VRHALAGTSCSSCRPLGRWRVFYLAWARVRSAGCSRIRCCTSSTGRSLALRRRQSCSGAVIASSEGSLAVRRVIANSALGGPASRLERGSGGGRRCMFGPAAPARDSIWGGGWSSMNAAEWQFRLLSQPPCWVGRRSVYRASRRMAPGSTRSRRRPSTPRSGRLERYCAQTIDASAYRRIDGPDLRARGPVQ